MIPFVFDIETEGLRTWGVDRKIHFVNTRYNGRNRIQTPDRAHDVLGALSDPAFLLVAHEAVFDLSGIATINPQWRRAVLDLPPERVFCTRLAHHAIHPATPSDLMSLAKHILERDVRDKIAPQDYKSGDIRPEYMIFDLEVAGDLHRVFNEIIDTTPGLQSGWRELLQPLTAIAAKMRVRGLPFDSGAAASLAVHIGEEREKAQRSLWRRGLPREIRGTQVGKVARWIERTFHPSLPLTDGGAPSLNKQNLADHDATSPYWTDDRGNPQIRDEETIAAGVKALAAYSRFSTLEAARKNINRYIDAVAAAPDGRLHPGWRPAAAITDRWTCSPDNAQNIPKRGEKFGAAFRALFRPLEPGKARVDADLSGIEMRLIAHYSRDAEFIRLLTESDPHAEAIPLIFLKSPKRYYKDMRQIAKHYSFGSSYGGGTDRMEQVVLQMADSAGIPRKLIRPAPEARARWAERFPGAANFGNRISRVVEADGFIVNEYGRPIPVDRNQSFVGANYQVQSTPACILSRAIQRLEREGIPVVAQIHDELWTFECDAREAPDVAQHVREAMEQDSGMFRVPITADVEILYADEAREKGGDKPALPRPSSGAGLPFARPRPTPKGGQS